MILVRSLSRLIPMGPWVWAVSMMNGDIAERYGLDVNADLEIVDVV